MNIYMNWMKFMKVLMKNLMFWLLMVIWIPVFFIMPHPMIFWWEFQILTSSTWIIISGNLIDQMWIYSHHIYSTRKRKMIQDLAHQLKLTGFCRPGKPGMTHEFWITWNDLNISISHRIHLYRGNRRWLSTFLESNTIWKLAEDISHSKDSSATTTLHII